MELDFGMLRHTFILGKLLKKKYFAVEVTIPGCEATEVIINPMCNVSEKLVYYGEKYTWDLKLLFNHPIRIVGFAVGDSYEEIKTNLRLGKELK